MTAPHTGLHDAVAHVATLLGSWSGQGRGEYPTIDTFEYVETVTFGHVGKPFLTYGQRTRELVDGVPGLPLHAESGYWRFPAPGRVEVVIVHPTGVTEIEEGTIAIDGGVTVIELASSSVGLSSTAKSVTEIGRSFRIDGDQLDYTVRMAAVGLPLQHHLAASLHRDPA